MTKRVVITGIGLLTPVGNGTIETFDALINGKSGVGLITYFDTADHYVKIAAEIKDFHPEEYVDKKDIKIFDKFIVYALSAAEMARRDANLDVATIDSVKAGVTIGSIIGGIRLIEETCEVYRTKGAKRISPFYIPSVAINMASGVVSIKYNFKGPNFSIVSACATGAHCVGEAFRIIQKGDADIMFAGGAESCITPTTIGGFASMKALSRRNDEPQKASRPFDKNRDGFVNGRRCWNFDT